MFSECVTAMFGSCDGSLGTSAPAWMPSPKHRATVLWSIIGAFPSSDDLRGETRRELEEVAGRPGERNGSGDERADTSRHDGHGVRVDESERPFLRVRRCGDVREECC